MTLLLQIVATLIAAHALAFVARRLGQPSVIGEIAGGIVLGPTILGALWPEAFHTLFPPGSLGPLKLLAEIGVVLFMFRVGLEVDLGALRRSTRQAAVISAVSITVPFALGVALSFALIPPGKSPLVFTLFFGVAMAITAFPVLARILTERGMTATPVGRMALACAAINDLVAWMLLAAVVAAVKGGHGSVGLGVYGVFAAFVAGVIVPLDPERVKRFFSIVSAVLLPLFFAYVGVRTQITLLRDWTSVLFCLAVIAVATLGKLGGASLAARRTGMPWREAFALGALMNTRGLMELVALNIGYDLGILTPEIFAILVVMALVTTIATGPLLAAARTRRTEEG